MHNPSHRRVSTSDPADNLPPGSQNPTPAVGPYISTSPHDNPSNDVSRRRLIAGAGAAGLLAATTGLIPGAGADTALAACPADIMVSVKDFGAVGDGVTDDSVAIQNAINATATGNAQVIIPGGVYRLGTPLIMRNDLTLRGANRAGTILRLAPDNAGPILDAPQVAGAYQDVSNLAVADLTFDGDASHTTVPGAQATAPLLRSYQSHNWNLVRCRFTGSRGYGFGLLGDPRTNLAGKQGPHEDTYLLDCIFDENGTVDTGNGVTTLSAKRLTLEHCNAIDNSVTGFYLRAQFAALVGCNALNNTSGFILDSTANLANSTDDDAYITVLGGSAEANSGVGLAVIRESDQSIDEGRTHATISGFNSRKNGGHGLGASKPLAPYTDTAISLIVIGGHYDWNGSRGIALQGPRDLIIDGATCIQNTKEGIFLLDTVNAIVTGCQLRENNGWGMYLGGATDGIATVGNIMHNNLAGDFNNSGSSSTSIGNRSGQSFSLAASSTITIPSTIDDVSVTGNSNISTVSSSFDGRIVTLQFVDSPVVVAGSNLKMEEDFEATPNDTLTLLYRDGFWYELARSHNS